MSLPASPYYEQDGITIYLGDCREITPSLDAACMVTDPPYGINYKSGMESPNGLARSIQGDLDTSVRDFILEDWQEEPAIVFGTWRIPRPAGTRMLLVWDTKGANGMGDLSLPWKPAHQEIYILGRGFAGKRDTDVLAYAPVQSMAKNGRVHPHQKPLNLMRNLIGKCPPGTILDPFMGSGTTLVAAKLEGRKAIGIELEEKYCEIAAKRLAQGVLNFD